MRAEAFHALLARVLPGPHPPWDALWWDARIHFVIFVHRVDGVAARSLLPACAVPLPCRG